MDKSVGVSTHKPYAWGNETQIIQDLKNYSITSSLKINTNVFQNWEGNDQKQTLT